MHEAKESMRVTVVTVLCDEFYMSSWGAGVSTWMKL